MSGLSSVGAIAKCLSEYFQKQFELSDIMTLQIEHVVHREFYFGLSVVVKPVYCSVGSCVVVH